MEQNINIDPRDLPNLECEKCQSQVFVETATFKKVSPLISGAAKMQLMPIPVYMCVKCQHINEEFSMALTQNKLVT